jgi:hypothetical protein
MIVWAFCALLAAMLAAPVQPGRADIGWPPLNPAGASPGLPTGVETNVRMLSEEVNITIEAHARPATGQGEDSPANAMRAQVEAVFLMRNLGQADETFDVWFPLAASLRYPGMLPYFPDKYLRDFKLWIDGEPTRYEQVKAPDVGDPSQESLWARFPMSFPAGKDVHVRLSYLLYPTGRRPFGGFEYILQTGAGWKGTIGQVNLNVYLPDTITPENVSLSGRSIEGLPIQPQPEGYVIEDNVIRWQFTDLEPTAEHNLYVDVLEPQRYRELLSARAQAENAPNSPEAQIALARATRNAVMVVKTVGQHGGGAALGEQVNVAYRRAIELAPNRVKLVREYAGWLMRTVGWMSLRGEAACYPELCALLEKGLQDFPGDPELSELYENIQQQIEENAPYATQWALTQAVTQQALSTQEALGTQQALEAQATASQAAVEATRQALPSPTAVIPTATAIAAAAATLAPVVTPPVETPAQATPTEAAPQSPRLECFSIALPMVGLAGARWVARRRKA